MSHQITEGNLGPRWSIRPIDKHCCTRIEDQIDYLSAVQNARGWSIGPSSAYNPQTCFTTSCRTLRSLSFISLSLCVTSLHQSTSTTYVRTMSDSSEESWSDNPNAPQIPPWLHTFEKVFFASYAVGEILYGMPTCVSFHLHLPRCLTYRSRDHCYSVLSMHRSID